MAENPRKNRKREPVKGVEEYITLQGIEVALKSQLKHIRKRMRLLVDRANKSN